MSNTIKKTNRKNKTNQTIKWMNEYFTIKDLQDANPGMINITLRSKVNAAIKDNKIAKLGSIHNGKGRPKIVLAMTPVSQELLDKARKAGVIFDSPYDTVAVVSLEKSMQEDNDLKTNNDSLKNHTIDNKINV